ncbi:MAG: zinc ribbon domain-containing protein [Planctomycetota bacterium]
MGSVDGPLESIKEIVQEMSSASDEEVLVALAAMEPLPDESDQCWDDDSFWTDVAYRFLGLAEVAKLRRIRPAVRLILERACYGDPGETMRGLRHVFEGIYAPDWASLADEYMALARSERLGTRMWAIDGLVVLDDSRAIPIFEESLEEDPEDIRWLAEIGLQRLLHPEEIAAEAERRHAEMEQAQKEALERQAERDARVTSHRCPNCGKPLPSYRRTCKYCGRPVEK